MKGDLTQGPVMRTMLAFAFPMIISNLLQQSYNVVDTLIVGRFIGPNALAAVGSSFTLMTFLISILLGLSMGSGAVFSIRFGQKDFDGLKECIFTSFLLIALFSTVLNLLAFKEINLILVFLRVPDEIKGLMREYLLVIFFGIPAVFLYNYFSCLLRAIGNSIAPLLLLATSSILNIVLELWFVLVLKRGVGGSAEATVIAQYVSGIGIAAYIWFRCPWLRIQKKHCRIHLSCLKEIAGFSMLTCIQQSVMNLGILMVQGLVNSFGTTVMAAFAAAVKIDAFAYMPVQDFGNAFSSFIAQNYGAGQNERIRSGFKGAILSSMLFCLAASCAIWLLARPLMLLFLNGGEEAILAEGVRYLRIESAFYCAIGCLFLLYGLFRALGRPGMSIVLTFISLGLRVALSYILSSMPAFGVTGIWWSVPIGWILADAIGLAYFARWRQPKRCSRVE